MRLCHLQSRYTHLCQYVRRKRTRDARFTCLKLLNKNIAADNYKVVEETEEMTIVMGRVFVFTFVECVCPLQSFASPSNC